MIGIIILAVGIILCIAGQVVYGVPAVIVGLGLMAIPSDTKTKKTKNTQSPVQKNASTPKKKTTTSKKNVVVDTTGAPAADAYAYPGTCEEYFYVLLLGCFSGYEVVRGNEAHNAPASNAWECACGTVNTGKFCSDCGTAKPVSKTWTCHCGHINTSKFCAECGAPKPVITVTTAVRTNAPTFVLRQNGQAVLGIHLCGKNEWNSEPVLQVVDDCRSSGYDCLCFYTEFRNEAGYVVDRVRNALN